MIPAYDAFKVGKFGPKLDPTGAHVLYADRLWEVVKAEYQEFPPAYGLRLRTFNREVSTWAPLSACKVLEREAE